MAKTDERRKLEDAAREFMEQHTAPRSQRKAQGLLDLLSEDRKSVQPQPSERDGSPSPGSNSTPGMGAALSRKHCASFSGTWMAASTITDHLSCECNAGPQSDLAIQWLT